MTALGISQSGHQRLEEAIYETPDQPVELLKPKRNGHDTYSSAEVGCEHHRRSFAITNLIVLAGPLAD